MVLIKKQERCRGGEKGCVEVLEETPATGTCEVEGRDYGEGWALKCHITTTLIPTLVDHEVGGWWGKNNNTAVLPKSGIWKRTMGQTQ